MQKTKEEILSISNKEGIKFIEMQFMDILGHVKTVSIPARLLEKAINEGVLFDGSSIVGYATINESDMRAVPDLSTFQIFPWTENSIKTARLICDIYDSSGNRFEGDPRYVLQKSLKKAKDMGFRFNTGPEFEFFLFRLDNSGIVLPEPDDKGGYFDLLPDDRAEHVRKESALILDMMDFNVEATHHEVSPGQHEVDLKYTDAMRSANRIMTLKYAIKTVAMKHGLFASFMPKPIYGINGNGMHIHMSLENLDGQNAFYDANTKDMLSDTAKYFIGGLIDHSLETCGVIASWVNSYKRLVPGYEAPVYVSWDHLNRSALFRVPAGREKNTRVEVRNPDPAGNPYLQFAVLLESGLDGIKNKTFPPEPSHINLFEEKNDSIKVLPENLGHALSYMENSDFIKEALGEHLFNNFLYIKKKEWEDYRSQITEWELKNLLPLL